MPDMILSGLSSLLAERLNLKTLFLVREPERVSHADSAHRVETEHCGLHEMITVVFHEIAYLLENVLKLSLHKYTPLKIM